ncbi:MAG: hypothetical protein R3F19_34110 [Verrucomicrobiales bacterium]
MQVELIESYRLADSLADSDPLRNETYRKVGGQLRELIASLNGDHEAIATALQGFVDQGADPSFLRTFLHFLSRSDPKFAAANIDVIKDTRERNLCANLIWGSLFKAGELEFAEKWVDSTLKGDSQVRGREMLIDALIKAGKIENAVGQWELMEPTLRRRATRSLFEAFAKKDLASTIKIVESSSANDFGPASDGLLATLNSSAEIENALAMASNDTLRSELANKIVSIDTKADATVADTVTSATTLASRLGVELDGVLAKALMEWTNKNALATADYMLQHREDAPLASKKFEPYFNSAISRSIKRNPQATAEWASQVEDAKLRWKLIDTTVTEWFALDSRSLSEWVGAAASGDVKDTAIRSMVKQLEKSGDADSAAQWRSLVGK